MVALREVVWTNILLGNRERFPPQIYMLILRGFKMKWTETCGKFYIKGHRYPMIIPTITKMSLFYPPRLMHTHAGPWHSCSKGQSRWLIEHGTTLTHFEMVESTLITRVLRYRNILNTACRKESLNSLLNSQYSRASPKWTLEPMENRYLSAIISLLSTC